MANITRRSDLAKLDPFFSSPLALFEDMVNRFFSEPVSARPWYPAVDIAENENEIVLTADIPGVKMEDIELKIENGTLTISGSREFKKEEKEGGYHRIERSYGSFHRAFTLPDTVDTDKIEATYEDGVLKVVLPKKEVAKPKTVKIAVKK
ncbi:MAG: heat-shock protein Hsp20 [Bryobacteraceae bacterium]|nr:MAG: heat-shock protein Hsp20 [Bryobacteraceae bacterium]